MKTTQDPEAAETAQTTDSPAVDLPRLVLPLPDSPGWWWCRFNGSYLPGDEMCVEVTSVHGDQVIVHWGRDHDYIRPENQLRDITAWFHGLEWVKAESPWQND